MNGGRLMKAALAGALSLALAFGGVTPAAFTRPALAYADDDNLSEEERAREKLLKKTYKIPVASNKIQGWPKGPGTYGEAACVMDMESGAFLYNKKMNTKQYPASITKIMTAYVTCKYGDLKGKVHFYPEDISFLEPGDASIGMKPGEIIRMKDAMYAMLLHSANEVSHAIIRTVGRKVRKDGKFKVPGAPKEAANEQELDYAWGIALMNYEAGQLGCTNSHFTNANGLHNENHYVSAHDMCLIGAAAYHYKYFRNVTQTLTYTIPRYRKYRYVDKNGKTVSPKNKKARKKAKKIRTGLYTVEARGFSQYHKMLYPTSEYYYPVCTGGKTGFTDQASTTLVTFGERNGRKLVVVCLHTYGAENVYNDTRALMEYGLTKFKKRTLQAEDITKIANRKAAGDDARKGVGRKVTMIDDDSAVLTIPRGKKLTEITSATNYDFGNFSLSSGTLDFYYGDMSVGRIGVHFESLASSVKNALNRAHELKYAQE